MLKEIELVEKKNFKKEKTLKFDDEKRLIDAVMFVSKTYNLKNKEFFFLKNYDVNKKIKEFDLKKEGIYDSVYLEFIRNDDIRMIMLII